jgi:hypothetical protein
VHRFNNCHAQWTPSGGLFLASRCSCGQTTRLWNRLPPGRLKPEKEQKEFR